MPVMRPITWPVRSWKSWAIMMFISSARVATAPAADSFMLAIVRWAISRHSASLAPLSSSACQPPDSSAARVSMASCRGPAASVASSTFLAACSDRRAT